VARGGEVHRDRFDGDTPLPMNCDGDDMQRHYIGRDERFYPIWGSLPFTDVTREAGSDAVSERRGYAS